MRQLQHENIVKYIGSELVGLDFCIYMECVENGSLERFYTQKNNDFTEKEIQQFTVQILKGLSYLHENNIIHCDLKCSNILIGMDSSLKLSDFGCAKIFDAGVSAQTMSNAVKGSVSWMAPEVLKGEKYTKKGDIYSLGATLIEMVVR